MARFVQRRPGERHTLRREWEVQCCVHGWQYYDGPRILANLTEGQRLILEREPDNPKDANAVIVKTKEGQKLGYIPRRLAPSFAKRMDRKIDVQEATHDFVLGQAYIRQIDPLAPPFGRLTIEVRFQGNLIHQGR